MHLSDTDNSELGSPVLSGCFTSNRQGVSEYLSIIRNLGATYPTFPLHQKEEAILLTIETGKKTSIIMTAECRAENKWEKNDHSWEYLELLSSWGLQAAMSYSHLKTSENGLFGSLVLVPNASGWNLPFKKNPVLCLLFSINITITSWIPRV